MTGVNGINKFTNLLAVTSSQNQPGDALYYVDLQTILEDVGNQHVQEGTMPSACGCMSANWTLCGC